MSLSTVGLSDKEFFRVEKYFYLIFQIGLVGFSIYRPVGLPEGDFSVCFFFGGIILVATHWVIFVCSFGPKAKYGMYNVLASLLGVFGSNRQ